MGISDVAAAAATKSSFNPSTLILILVVVVGFYMLMIRPQRRRQQQAQQRQNSVQPGARVRTTAGMYATVVEVDGDDVVLEVAPGVEVRYVRRAIMEVIQPGEAVEDEEPEGFYEDAHDEEEDGTPQGADGVKSADDGRTDSHEDLASPTRTTCAEPEGLREPADLR